MVQKFMTRTPHTIRLDQSLSVAQQLMREHAIRHLPVLEDGRLAGLLSQRDLHLIADLKHVDPTQVCVSEAMSTDVYMVNPHTSVRKIAIEMATHMYGSAVVMDGESIVGVFTTTDALLLLSELLRPARHGKCTGPRPAAPLRSKGDGHGIAENDTAGDRLQRERKTCSARSC